jgi:hypothetical protein
VRSFRCKRFVGEGWVSVSTTSAAASTAVMKRRQKEGAVEGRPKQRGRQRHEEHKHQGRALRLQGDQSVEKRTVPRFHSRPKFQFMAGWTLHFFAFIFKLQAMTERAEMIKKSLIQPKDFSVVATVW